MSFRCVDSIRLAQRNTILRFLSTFRTWRANVSGGAECKQRSCKWSGTMQKTSINIWTILRKTLFYFQPLPLRDVFVFVQFNWHFFTICSENEERFFAYINHRVEQNRFKVHLVFRTTKAIALTWMMIFFLLDIFIRSTIEASSLVLFSYFFKVLINISICCTLDIVSWNWFFVLFCWTQLVNRLPLQRHIFPCKKMRNLEFRWKQNSHLN